MKIKNIKAREILDSRGFPTIECSMTLDNGSTVEASVPAGASVGKHEAIEMRDKDPKRFDGKGVLKAIDNIEKMIATLLVGKNPDVLAMDKVMQKYDGTDDKSKLGANAILAASIAVTRAQALCENVEVFALLEGLFKKRCAAMPSCMFNMINGGMHANNKLLFQEFMVMPLGDKSFKEKLHMAVLIYHRLGCIIEEQGYLSTVGDEGGFAPALREIGKMKERRALDIMMMAIESLGLKPSVDVGLCLDVAATHFYDAKRGVYCFDGECMSSSDMVDVYVELIKKYPICSIEDGMSEDDWHGWRVLTSALSAKVTLVGDDVFVTDSTLIQKGADSNVATAVLIKPNQIGTVSEAMMAVQKTNDVGYLAVASHRSGETNDSFIADFAVGVGAKRLKAGAPARGERVSKYNRLLAIEAMLPAR